MNNLQSFTTRKELRDFLTNNHLTEKECWLTISIKEQANTLLYLDVVEEALCFGWIDGVKKKISPTQLIQRISPRTKKSSWTELNKERIRCLHRKGLMTPHGLKVAPDLSTSSFIIDNDILERLKEDEETYRNFLKFPPLYQRVRIDTIQSYKKDKETFEKRLNKFIEKTKLNLLYGQWNDNGRLLE